MYSFQSLPPPKHILSAAASLTASALLFKSITTTLLPTDLNDYLSTSFKTLFNRLSAHLTVVIHDSDGLTPNQLFEAANLYLGTKLSNSTLRIKATKPEHEHDLTISPDRNQRITDTFNSVKCTWVLHTEHVDINPGSNARSELKYFELSFHKKHKQIIFTQYLHHVLHAANEIKNNKKVVKLHTVDYNGTDYWSAVVLNHPATFETIAMDVEKKAEIMEDVELFVRRKEYYRRVGRAWKRGYLFYGPAGTGKSSLVAAMANYLKFDVYDLDLKEVQCNSDLRRLLIGTKNRSIIVIEDIDCNVGVQISRELQNNQDQDTDDKITLSGLLNFIDGLWSSCGDERIIVFTTNHKERLDAALLRPGRMDVHVEMSYCTYDGFKILASTYLQVKEDEHLRIFEVVKEALKKIKVTPAEIAGELMKGENVEIVLQNLIRWLQTKDEMN